MQSRKVGESLVYNKLRPKDIIQIVKNYAKHLQHLNNWK